MIDDPRNFVTVMVYICDTFGLTHPQMMRLRQKLETVYRGQPKAYAKKSREPVSLSGLAIALGLLIGFGGGDGAVGSVLKVSRDKLIALGREYDPRA